MQARYKGKCPGCGEAFAAGATIARHRNGRWGHIRCAVAPAVRVAPHVNTANADYQRGVADAEAYIGDRQWLGEDMANALAFERDFNAPEGW